MISYKEIKKDLTAYREKFEYFREKILDSLEQAIYRYERYHQEFSALVVYAENHNIQMDICCNAIRKSDHVYPLSSNLILVCFDMADASVALKAAQNFQYAYMQHDVNQELFFSLAPIAQNDTAIDIASRLLIILDYALSENLVNVIVDLDAMRQK